MLLNLFTSPSILHKFLFISSITLGLKNMISIILYPQTKVLREKKKKKHGKTTKLTKSLEKI